MGCVIRLYSYIHMRKKMSEVFPKRVEIFLASLSVSSLWRNTECRMGPKVCTPWLLVPTMSTHSLLLITGLPFVKC